MDSMDSQWSWGLCVMPLLQQETVMDSDTTTKATTQNAAVSI